MLIIGWANCNHINIYDKDGNKVAEIYEKRDQTGPLRGIGIKADPEVNILRAEIDEKDELFQPNRLRLNPRTVY